MSDPNVDSWRQHGHVYLWRGPGETRNYPGWNFAADTEGLESMADLIGRMLRARWNASAAVVANAPSGTATAPRFSASDLRPARFTLRFPVGKVPERHWAWAGTAAHPILTLGHAKLAELQGALMMLAAGEDDFRMGPDDQKKHHDAAPERLSMWFWSVA